MLFSTLVLISYLQFVMDGPFETTFGIELEFIVLYHRENYIEACNRAFGHHDHVGDEFERILERDIVDVLRANKFAVNDAHHDNAMNWTVTTDSTVELEQEELPQHLRAFDSYAIELKSPAYRYTIEALLEVQRGVGLVKGKFEIFVNETCGFHVHVGNLDRGFTLETVKNLALLVTIFERQINQLHPRHRNTNEWCRTPKSQFLGRNLWEVVEAIESMPDMVNLISLMCSERLFPSGSKYRAYNLCNLTDDNLRTIEFRQHQGTMNEYYIDAWIHLTCSLVSLSHSAGPVGFIELVKERADNPNFTVIDLLYNLGLGDVGRAYFMQYYSTRSISRRRRRDLWVDPSTGEWLTVRNGDESGSDSTDSNGDTGEDQDNDGSGGSQDGNSYLNQLYNRMEWNGGRVNNHDVQVINETFWKDF